MNNLIVLFYLIGHFYLEVLTLNFSGAAVTLKIISIHVSYAGRSVDGSRPSTTALLMALFGLCCVLLTIQLILLPLYFLI